MGDLKAFNMNDSWTVEIVFATMTTKTFEFTNKQHPDLRIEVRASSEEEAWEKFKKAFEQ